GEYARQFSSSQTRNGRRVERDRPAVKRRMGLRAFLLFAVFRRRFLALRRRGSPRRRWCSLPLLRWGSLGLLPRWRRYTPVPLLCLVALCLRRRINWPRLRLLTRWLRRPSGLNRRLPLLHRRRKRAVWWLYARLLLRNCRGLHRLRLTLLNRRRCKWPVLRRRNWGWPIRLQRLNLLLLR